LRSPRSRIPGSAGRRGGLSRRLDYPAGMTTPPVPDLAVARFVEAGLDVDPSTLTRALYSSDASLYRVVPAAVARPWTVDELVTTLRLARGQDIPVTMRGSGTSCAGNAVGPGLVIDLRRLDRIEAIDPQRRTAVVEPGVVQHQLSTAAGTHGLLFGPDPSTSTRCTIGGMIGNNACGPRAMGYGRTADNVVALEVVTGDGELLVVGDPDSDLVQQARDRGLPGVDEHPTTSELRRL